MITLFILKQSDKTEAAVIFLSDILPLRHFQGSNRCKPLIARLVEADLVDHKVESKHGGRPEGVADKRTRVHARERERERERVLFTMVWEFTRWTRDR